MNSIKSSTVIRAAAKAILVEQALEEDAAWAELLWNAAKRMEYRAALVDQDEALIKGAN